MFWKSGNQLATLLLRRLSNMVFHWASTESVDITLFFSRRLNYPVTVFLHSLNNSERHFVGILSQKPLKTRVIGLHYTLWPINLRMEPLHCLYITYGFTFCCGVIYSRFTQNSDSKAIGRSSPSTICDKTAPSAVSLASVSITKGWRKFWNA